MKRLDRPRVLHVHVTVVVLLVCVYVCVCVCVCMCVCMCVCVCVCVCVCDSEIKTPVKNELQLGTANTGGGEALRSTLVAPRSRVPTYPT